MYQRTPLHTAAGAGYRYTVEYLVKKGADITIKDNKEVSVWDYTTFDWKYYVNYIDVNMIYGNMYTVIDNKM